MSKSNKGKGRQHINVLKLSRMDIVLLGEAVETRFLELCKTHLKIKGEELPIPSHLDKDMVLWRTMRIRHKSRDFRNTEDEFKSVKRIADWTHLVNCQLKGQKYTPIEWE